MKSAHVILLVWLVILTGWILNIVAVCQSNFNEVTGMLVCRCIGIIVFPVGAVVGWL